MSLLSTPVEAGDVYSVREVARAAASSVRDVLALIASAQVSTVGRRFLTEREAIRATRLLTGRSQEPFRHAALFQPPRQTGRSTAAPYAASTAIHAALVAGIAMLTAIGLQTTASEQHKLDHTRLVFLAIPGPGGGGGGGGLRQPTPAARAELKGKSVLRSPVRTEPKRAKVETPPKPARPPEPRPVEKPPDVPVAPQASPVPPVVAPVVPVAPDLRNLPGVVQQPAALPPSAGPGTGGGSGTGKGTGMGEGKGPGIGDGEGGGTGGGPYRPGSGITPPSVLREVKPQYTEEARRLGVEGDVVLEIVVRADGSVGQISLVHRLGSGLDQRAVDAVRQWRFSPARRHGTPVDVLVEVAVEFKLR
jgi:periplasmic protein TonB